LGKPKNASQVDWNLKLGVGVAGQALRLREPVMINDVDVHPWYVKSASGSQIKSLLVAPLFNPKTGELYGTLSVTNHRENAFTSEDESSLAALSYQGSIAISRVRGFTLWRKQGGTMRHILDDVRNYKIESADENSLWKQIVSTAARRLGFKIVRLMLLNPLTNELTTVAVNPSKQNANKQIYQPVPLSVLEPFLTSKYRAGHSYLIPNESPEWKTKANQYFNNGSHLYKKQANQLPHEVSLTPLMDYSGQMIGLLSLDMPETGTTPHPQILESIGVFANAASWMIELHRAQRHIDEQRLRTEVFINSISGELAKERDFQAIGEVIVQVGSRLFGTEGCSLYIVKGDKLELTHSTFLSGTPYIEKKKPITDMEKCGLSVWVAKTGKELHFANEEYKSHPAWAREQEFFYHLPNHLCKSLLIAPVKDQENRIIGVIELINKKTASGFKDFDIHDVSRLRFLAYELSLALGNISRFDAIQSWERKGIEDDLHELVNLYHLGVVSRIDALDEWLRRGNDAKVKELVPVIRHHAHTTTIELKNIHTNLISKCLESDNLREALERLADAWSKRVRRKNDTDLSITVICPRKLEIPAQSRNILVRIASEALTNSIQHSEALEDPKIKISIKVIKTKNEIKLIISDTGKGMDMDTTIEGFGISRMKQLTRQLDGIEGIEAKFDLRSAIGKGSKVTVFISLLDNGAETAKIKEFKENDNGNKKD
jgi:anti-sigma regulatory factor (Ser/Thr protein kinase)